MLSDELITRIAAALDTMPPKAMSHHELVMLVAQIEAKIRAAQERGATYAEIAEQLATCGYPVSERRLRDAVQRHRRANAGAKRRRQRGKRARKAPGAVPKA